MPYVVEAATAAVNAQADPKQAQFQSDVAKLINQTLGTDGTTYALYKTIALAVIQNAAKSDFLNNELQYLTVLPDPSSKTNKSITFALTGAAANAKDNGEIYFKSRIVERKRSALLRYFAYLLDASVAPSIAALYQNNAPYKSLVSGQQPILADILSTIQQQVTNYTSGDLDKAAADYDALLKKVLESPPEFYKQLKVAAGTAATRFTTEVGQNILEMLVALLNGGIPLKGTLVDLLLDQVRKNCLKSPRALTSNRARVHAILENLQVKGDILNKDTKPTVGNGPFAEGLEAGRLALRALADSKAVQGVHLKSILYSEPQLILAPATSRLADQTYATVGLAALKEASSLAFDANAIAGALTQELYGVVNSFLAGIAIKVSWKAADGTVTAIDPLKAMKPYVLYDLDDYANAIGKLKHSKNYDIATQIYETTINSVDIPFLDVVGSRFDFYNCQSFLYLNDMAAPDKVYSFNQAVATQIVSVIDSGKAKNPAVERSKIVTALKCRASFDLSFRRTYVALYAVTPGAIAPALMWWKTSGLGDGVSRADDIDDSYYRWTFNGDIAKLKTALGLDPATSQGFDAKTIGAFVGLTPGSFRGVPGNLAAGVAIADEKGANDTTYNFLAEKGKTDDADLLFFVRCNSPYPPPGSKPPSSGQLNLESFQFGYYRIAGFGGGARGTLKTIKAATSKKNRPLPGDVPDDCKNAQYVGVNLPVCMGIGANYTAFASGKKSRAVIKNKGNILTKNLTFRKDAGKVMAAIAPYLVGGNSPVPVLPAGRLAGAVVPRPKALKDWQGLKATTLKQLPTDQEWCHLQGHGDNGDERVGNFVSGSKHCNTEQLAIESAQRPTTTQTKVDEAYILKSTAYLVADDSMGVVNNKSYLGEDASYPAAAYGKNPKQQPISKDAVLAADLKITQANAPVAAFIRYKVFRSKTTTTASSTGQAVTTTTHEKLIDYVFEGQSEFFDVNQYYILYYSIYLLTNPQGFCNELRDFYETNR